MKELKKNWQFPDMRVAFQIPYVYDYTTDLCRKQGEIIQIMKMKIYAIMDKEKP
jgi:hypothetical protein